MPARKVLVSPQGCGPNPLSLPFITSTSPLPNGTVNVAYSFTFQAQSGTPPYTWSSTPLGAFSLNSSTGTMSGTGAVSGTFNFNVGVTDSLNYGTGLEPFQLTILPNAPVITSSSPLPNATVNVPYSFTFQATGGTPPYTWSSSGTGAYTLNASTGVLSGTGAVSGVFTFTVTVTDSLGTPSAPTSFQLTVSAASGAPFDFYIGPNGDDSAAGTVLNPWSVTALGTLANRTTAVTNTTGCKWGTYAGKRVGMIGGHYTKGSFNGIPTTLFSLTQQTTDPQHPGVGGVGIALWINGAPFSAPTNLFSLPSVTGIVGFPGSGQNFFVAGGSGPAFPVNGTMNGLSNQKNPQLSSGNFQPNPWNAGAFTGFTPTNPATAQIGYAATGQTTTAQWEGNTFGAYMQSIDRPTDPADSKMGVWPEIRYPVGTQTIYTNLGDTITHSMQMQIPTASATAGGAKSIYVNVLDQYNGPGGILVATSVRIFFLPATQVPPVTVSQDPNTLTYLINVSLDASAGAGYLTKISGEFTNVPWTGFLPFSFSISGGQFQRGLKLLQSNYGITAIPSVDPTQYTLKNSHINAEFHFTPVTDDCTLGWSIQNWNATLTTAGTTYIGACDSAGNALLGTPGLPTVILDFSSDGNQGISGVNSVSQYASSIAFGQSFVGSNGGPPFNWGNLVIDGLKICGFAQYGMFFGDGIGGTAHGGQVTIKNCEVSGGYGFHDNNPGGIFINKVDQGGGPQILNSWIHDCYSSDQTQYLVGTASFSGAIMTLQSVASGSFTLGSLGFPIKLYSAGVPAGTTITGVASGTLGAVGSTYNISASVGTIATQAFGAGWAGSIAAPWASTSLACFNQGANHIVCTNVSVARTYAHIVKTQQGAVDYRYCHFEFGDMGVYTNGGGSSPFDIPWSTPISGTSYFNNNIVVGGIYTGSADLGVKNSGANIVVNNTFYMSKLANGAGGFWANANDTTGTVNQSGNYFWDDSGTTYASGYGGMTNIGTGAAGTTSNNNFFQTGFIFRQANFGGGFTLPQWVTQTGLEAASTTLTTTPFVATPQSMVPSTFALTSGKGAVDGTTSTLGYPPGCTFATGGYDGVIAMNAAGRLVNGHGNPIQLRGFNLPMDSQIMGGFWNTNPGGTYFGSDGPPWPTIATWKANFVRITTNVSAFFNLPMGVLTGTAAAPTWSATNVAGDSVGNYKPQLIKLIQGARSAGCYLVIDVHWTAPDFTLAGVTKHGGAWGQMPFLDSGQGLSFWTAGQNAGPLDFNGSQTSGFVVWLAQNFGSAAFNTANNYNGGAAGTHWDSRYGGSSGFADIIFEIFNEPFYDQIGDAVAFNSASGGTGTTLTYQQLQLSGGWCSVYSNQGIGTGKGGVGIPAAVQDASKNFRQWWQTPGYQTVVNGIRALGATNICQCNSVSFAHKLCDVTTILPTDTLSPPQISTGWHPYESGTSGWPLAAGGPCDTGTNGTASAVVVGTNLMNGTGVLPKPIPVILTEYAPTNCGSGATDSGYMNNMHNTLDAQPTGSNGGTAWVWNPLGAGTGTGTQTEMESCYSANITFTASQSGTTLTLTSNATGPAFGAGSVLTGGGSVANNTTYDRPYVVKVLTGTAGQSGSTYQMSSASAFASSSMTAVNILPMPVQGVDDFNWMTKHN